MHLERFGSKMIENNPSIKKDLAPDVTAPHSHFPLKLSLKIIYSEIQKATKTTLIQNKFWLMKVYLIWIFK